MKKALKTTRFSTGLGSAERKGTLLRASADRDGKKGRKEDFRRGTETKMKRRMVWRGRQQRNSSNEA